jgi:hypothetical protein
MHGSGSIHAFVDVIEIEVLPVRHARHGLADQLAHRIKTLRHPAHVQAMTRSLHAMEQPRYTRLVRSSLRRIAIGDLSTYLHDKKSRGYDNEGPPMNNIQLTVALATAPSTAFNDQRERPRYWFPLLVVVFVSTAMVVWYYSYVDIDWLKDAIFANNPKFLQMPEADRAKALAMMGRGPMLWGSAVGAMIAIPVFFLLNALYCLLAAKVTKLPQGFKHWFSLTCWTALPVVLGSIVGAIMLLMSSNPQVAPGILQPLSVNELITHLPIGSPGQGMLDSLGIPGFLSWALMVIGVHTWSQRSWLFSVIFVFIPVVLLYGIWAAVAFK